MIRLACDNADLADSINNVKKCVCFLDILMTKSNFVALFDDRFM